MQNYLTLTDNRLVSGSRDWRVEGRIYENERDLTGTDVCEEFSNIDNALRFIRNTLC